MKCKACGAPIEIEDEKCPYCGTVTEYGEKKFRERESVKKEEERKRQLENLPAMKFVASSFVAVLYVCTLGCYAVYWYAMRLKPLNSLGTKTKIPAWLVAIFGLLTVWLFVAPVDLTAFGISEELLDEINTYVLSGIMLASGWLAFITRRLLHEYASTLMDRNQAVNLIAPSSVMLILFGAGYLQCQVNKMIKSNLFSPQV